MALKQLGEFADGGRLACAVDPGQHDDEWSDRTNEQRFFQGRQELDKSFSQKRRSKLGRATTSRITSPRRERSAPSGAFTKSVCRILRRLFKTDLPGRGLSHFALYQLPATRSMSLREANDGEEALDNRRFPAFLRRCSSPSPFSSPAPSARALCRLSPSQPSNLPAKQLRRPL